VRISKIINPVLNFFFPDACVICGDAPGKNNLSVCRRCLNKIEYIKPPYCQTCFLPLPDGGAHCWQCRKTKYHFEKVIAVGKYTGVLRKLILKFKEKEFLKPALGNLLLEVLTKNVDSNQFELIVAVPLSKKKEFGRDYNQSQLMASLLADKLNKKVVSGNLVRVKDTKPQFELTRKERLVNLRDAFFVKDSSLFKSKNIVLVDDIATTCSTLEECSKTLKNADAKKVFCAVLARD